MTDIAARKEQAAFWSVVASACLTIGKFGAGLLSGSLALLSEASHSLIDTGATLLTYFAVKAADQPADSDHHFGHAKIEAIAALAETVLLFILALGVVYEAFHRLMAGAHHQVEAHWLAFVVLLVSISTDFMRWRGLKRIAQETRSHALEADALHFSGDMFGSILVLMGLIAVYYGFELGDAIASIGVALFISIAGFQLGKKTIDTLVDTAPQGMADNIKYIIDNITGVIKTDYIRLRPSGIHIIGEIGIFVARTLTFEQVAKVKQDVLEQLAANYPDLQPTLTANPHALDDETIVERVLLVAARRRIPIHHVTVQGVNGQPSVSMDLEVDGTMALSTAHDIATGLEKDIAAEIGSSIEVETHLEPMEMDELEAINVSAIWAGKIYEKLSAYATEQNVIVDIHNIRVRESSGKLLVNYHCRAPGHLSISATHRAVDAIEHRLRQDYPQISRLVGHAEPIRL
jgi:cation diffusion facilitator family transporter